MKFDSHKTTYEEDSMKAIITSILAIVCFVVLVFGNISWNAKIKDAGANATANEETSAEDTNQTKQPITKEQASEIEEYISNWPEQSAEVFKQRLASGEPFRIVLAGSNEIENKDFSLEEALQSSIEKTFGSSIELTTITFDVTSTEFIAEGNEQELIDLSADMIIFESLTLIDNGEVVIEDSHENITTIMQAVTDDNPNASFILQPPPPLFSANFYPRQVEELKKFAEKNNIVYLDYWSSFPVEGTEDRASYFNESQDALNEDGYALWSGYVEDYLISR